MAEPALAPVTSPAPALTPEPSVVVATPPAGPPATELGGATPPVVPPVEETKLGPDGKPIVAEPPKPAEPVKFDAAKLALPEGMKTDDPLFQAFTGAMSDDKLDPQARGQALLDVYKKGIEAVKNSSIEAWNTMNNQWIGQVKADPEIGGTKFAEVKTTIAKAIDSLGPELSVAFRQGLDATGAGNHPAIWKGLAKMAALLTEGGHVSGTPTTGADKPSVKEAFYPNSPDMK